MSMGYSIKAFHGHYAIYDENEIIEECDTYHECEEEIEMMEKNNEMHNYVVFCESINPRNNNCNKLISHVEEISAHCKSEAEEIAASQYKRSEHVRILYVEEY